MKFDAQLCNLVRLWWMKAGCLWIDSPVWLSVYCIRNSSFKLFVFLSLVKLIILGLHLETCPWLICLCHQVTHTVFQCVVQSKKAIKARLMAGCFVETWIFAFLEQLHFHSNCISANLKECILWSGFLKILFTKFHYAWKPLVCRRFRPYGPPIYLSFLISTLCRYSHWSCVRCANLNTGQPKH